MSTMITFANDSLSDNFMTIDELKSVCPAAFKKTPTNPNVSEKYVQANTETVIRDLEVLGWKPVLAKQGKQKSGSSGIYSFHMIVFQNPDVKITKINNDGTTTTDSWPRIILTNSHDGFNAFKFMVGLFRCVCSNGLVISTAELANMTVRHINYDFETLRDIVNKAIESIPSLVETINKMKTVKLNSEEKIKLATEVMKIRRNVEDKDEKKFSVDSETINSILNPIREDDKSDDLWTVFNVCQEKLIKGGFYATNSKNKTRKQRGITSIKKDIDYNQRLWAAASNYIPKYSYS